MTLPAFSIVAISFNYVTLVVALSVLLQSRQLMNLILATFLAAVVINSISLFGFRLSFLFPFQIDRYVWVAASAIGGDPVFILGTIKAPTG